MKFTKSLLPLAVLTVLGAGVTGQAQATVYGLSKLEISNLSVVISPAANAFVTGFNFNLSNQSALNNVSISSVGSCSGTPANNNCGASGNVANAAVVSQGAPATAENLFTVHAPGSGQHSYADSLIINSQLSSAGANPTHTINIAEAELQGGTQASASSEIQSATGFTFTFTVGAPGSLAIAFSAIQEMEVDIINPFSAPAAAQANMKFEAKLSNDAGGYFAQWNPDGSALNTCILSGGAACSETADPFALNKQLSISSANVQNFDNTGAFGVNFTALTAGNYTFSLNEVKSISLTQATAVPEANSVLMLGMGLMSVYFGARRSRRQSV